MSKLKIIPANPRALLRQMHKGVTENFRQRDEGRFVRPTLQKLARRVTINRQPFVVRTSQDKES